MPAVELSQLLSPAQLSGYAAFILGVTAFLQRDDRRLKLFVFSENVAYAVHFFLLGNPPAATSAGVSGARTLLSLRYRSKRLALIIMTICVALGAGFAKTPSGWLPVVGSCCATWGMFTMHGIRMRLMVLGSTFLWLVNNILSGSIGGTVMEAFIATASVSTIARMSLLSRQAKLAGMGSGPVQ